MDEVLSNLDQPSLCFSLIRSAQSIFSKFSLLYSFLGFDRFLLSRQFLGLFSRFFSFKSSSRRSIWFCSRVYFLSKVVPGKQELFTEDCKALNPSTSRYWNQEMMFMQTFTHYNLENTFLFRCLTITFISELVFPKIYWKFWRSNFCPVFWGAFYCDGTEQHGTQVQ